MAEIYAENEKEEMVMGLFKKRTAEKESKRGAAWIIYNYGEPEYEFAECSECGHEADGTTYMGLMRCPECGRDILMKYRAEEIR